MKLHIDTIYGNGRMDSFQQVVLFEPDPSRENHVVNLYPEEQYQVFEGFGGALTEAAAYVYAQMDPRQKKQLLHAYFSPEEMGYSMLRIPIDSCDFSLSQYEALSDPQDAQLSGFSLEHLEQWIFPMLGDIQKESGRKIPLMLSPWSPPAFMKTNGKREGGGRLKREYYPKWAAYLCRYIREFRQRGYWVKRISLQNEPNAAQTWDSCLFTPQEQKVFLRDYMYPCMTENGLADVEIYLWDHNKERVFEWMREVIDETTDPMIAGAAFHWYSGDHFETLELSARHYPSKKLIVSESCIELSKYDPEDLSQAALALAHEVIGDLNHGIAAFYDWNLLLDEKGGPNYAGNYCLAPFHYDKNKKELSPNLIQKFYRQISHLLPGGSIRIACSKYTEQIDVTAFRRPDGAIVLLLLNRSETILPVCVRMNAGAAELWLYPKSLTTGCIPGPSDDAGNGLHSEAVG